MPGEVVIITTRSNRVPVVGTPCTRQRNATWSSAFTLLNLLPTPFREKDFPYLPLMSDNSTSGNSTEYAPFAVVNAKNRGGWIAITAVLGWGIVLICFFIRTYVRRVFLGNYGKDDAITAAATVGLIPGFHSFCTLILTLPSLQLFVKRFWCVCRFRMA